MTILITVDLDHADRRAQLTAVRELGVELSTHGVPARLRAEAVADEAKSGTGAQLATLAVQGIVSAGSIMALARVAIAFLQRQGLRKVVIERDGHRIEITGATARDQRRLIEWLTNDGVDQPEGGP
jgi:hypothetical protein